MSWHELPKNRTTNPKKKDINDRREAAKPRTHCTRNTLARKGEESNPLSLLLAVLSSNRLGIALIEAAVEGDVEGVKAASSSYKLDCDYGG
eukprot:scaffold34664_cov240-Amphora_coffeaeformis.AAC.2